MARTATTPASTATKTSEPTPTARKATAGTSATPAPAATAEKPAKAPRGMADAERIAKLLGVTITATEFAGVGKKIATDSGALYVNRGNIDVRATKEQVAAWVEAGHGVVRGNGTWLRVAF